MDLAYDLRAAFGFGTFRPGQHEAIVALEQGRDVQVLLPTGGGKSVCYQLPALRAARAGALTLVVSPLIALMEDQVTALQERGIPAELLRARQAWATARAARERLSQEGGLLYVSPERVATKGFSRWLAEQHVALVAIDEAHCVSEWGHDFRPNYRKLGVLKEMLGAPTIALTATATPRVLDDVAVSLGLEDPVRVVGRFERPNLSWSVEHHRGDKTRVARAAELIAAAPQGRIIIYAATRKRVVDVARSLRAEGHRVAHYHAGRTDGARQKAQDDFAAGKVRVLVATTAFGMGVDLPDVRLVVHVQAPGTLEAYVQQGGRAGRDGRQADCVLLYGPGDAVTQARLRGEHPGALRGWKALQDYVFAASCREQALVAYLGGTPGPACGRCDCCVQPEEVQSQVGSARAALAERQQQRQARVRREAAVEVSEQDRSVAVAFVRGLGKPLGRNLVAKGLRGSRAKAVKRKKLADNEHFGALAHLPEAVVQRTLDELLAEGRLAPRGRKYPTLWIPDKRVRSAQRTRVPKASVDPRKRELSSWRRREARKRRWKPYQVLTNATIDALIARRPRTRSELLEVPGIGPKKVERFGEALLQMVGAWGPP